MTFTRRLAIAFACLMPLLVPPALASAGSIPTPAQATALGKQAFLYGFPLLEFERVWATETSVRCPDGQGDAPVNTFDTATQFARPSYHTIVAPNVDTLYSIAHLDLGRGPVVLSHPDTHGRYFVFELLDPYTNVIGYIGSRTTGNRAGSFAITWSGHPGPRVPGTHVIRSRYRRVWIIGRTLVRSPSDQHRAVALMRRYRLTPPGGAVRIPRPCHPGKPRTAGTPSGLAFLTALDRDMAQNPPPPRDRPLLRRLATVGVGPGLNPRRAGLPAGVLNALGGSVKTTAAELPTIAKSTVLQEAEKHHGWADPASDIGNYGTDYQFRAGVAAVGLGANTPREAVYPTALTDSSGALLNGAERYELTFKPGQAPPEKAFWSLTMYDESGFLVPNPLHRYAIGTTHPPLRHEPDGSIVVLMQRSRPSQAGVNWLPTPNALFRLTLRIYWPKRSVLDGAWQPPPIELTGP
jgi:hypothetical protein